MPRNFDVFLSHNSRDKPAVRELAKALKARGLKVWFDEWTLAPGEDWQVALERAIETVYAATVVVGKDGLGPWEDHEMRALLTELVRRDLLVVPILLPGVENPPTLPLFLRRYMWLDLRPGITTEALDRLEEALRSRLPKRRTSRKKATKSALLSEVAIEYLGRLAERLNRTPWLKQGKPVLLSEVHVAPSVWKEELYIRDIAAVATSVDPATGPKNEPKFQTRKVRTLWQEEFTRASRTSPLVVIGGPGSGKTSLLAWTARQMALSAKNQLETGTATELEVRWPILANLDTWARMPGRPYESLVAATLQGSTIPEDWPDHRRAALETLLRARLTERSENTYLFLDALDQIRESRAQTIRSRLSDIGGFSPRMVISSRESGLTTLQPILPFPQLTIVQTAVLSSKEAKELAAAWLGSSEGAKLEEYLRSNSSLALVADSPLLLTLSCLVASIETGTIFPRTTAALYRAIMRHLAMGSWREPSPWSLASSDVEAFLGSVRRLAWQLFCSDPGANQFERESFVTGMTKATGSSISDSQNSLTRLIDLGFLESSGGPIGELEYHFRHATFREFLAAWHLASQINSSGWDHAEVSFRDDDGSWGSARVASLLDRNAFEPQWEPLFVFSAGMLNQPKSFFQMLADRQKDDLLRHRLDLLCRCYGTLSPEKEASLIHIVDGLFKDIKAIGSKSLRRRPERWRKWLDDVASLVAQPLAGERVVGLLIKMITDRNHREGMMHFERDVIELLSKAARGLQWQKSLGILLKLCEDSLGGHHEIGDAARSVVEVAESWEDLGSIERLAEIVYGQNQPQWRQVPIARALLRSASDKFAGDAVDFLVRTIEAGDSEGWIKLAALNSLTAGLGGVKELEVAEFILEALVDPMSHPGAGRDLIQGILEAAEYRRSHTIESLMTIASFLAKYDPHLASQFAGVFSRWNINGGVKRTTRFLWRLARATEADCYPRVKAFEGILAYGTADDRINAFAMLIEFAAGPVLDGRGVWLALEALLKAGQPYFGMTGELLRNLVTATGVHPHWLVHGCELALQQGDQTLVDSLAPQLLLISCGRATSQGVPDPDWSDKKGAAKLLRGTPHWATLEESALATLRGPDPESREDWHAVEVLAAGATSSKILKLTRELLEVGRRHFRPWHPLLRELDRRGWRFRIRIDRSVEVLRSGQEEPRPDSGDER